MSTDLPQESDQELDAPTGVEYGKETAPEPAPQFQGIHAILDSGQPFVTNFKGEPAAEWEFMAKVQGGGGHQLGDGQGRSIDLKHWFAHRVELQNQKTGEITTATRVVLVDSGGEVHTAVSDGIVNGLDIIRKIYGEGPYDGQVVAKVVQVNTRGGNRTYNLVPAK